MTDTYASLRHDILTECVVMALSMRLPTWSSEGKPMVYPKHAKPSKCRRGVREMIILPLTLGHTTAVNKTVSTLTPIFR